MKRERLVPDPAEVIQEIAEKANTVRGAATALTQRIEMFENYLSKVKGRVETMCFGLHPNAETEEESAELMLCLKFHRVDKAWIISWADFHQQYHSENPMSFSPLVDAPVKIKLAAIPMFSDLLESIAKSQDRLVEQITKGTQSFDAFAETLPNLEGK